MKVRKDTALWALLWDYAHGKRNTMASWSRAIKATKALGLNSDEQQFILHNLGYYDKNGLPYQWLRDATTRKSISQ